MPPSQPELHGSEAFTMDSNGALVDALEMGQWLLGRDLEAS